MENLKKFEELEEIKSVDLKKNLIDERRPFPKDLEDKVFQKLKLDWNYNSNAIEGNQLSFGETVAFLNFGLTAKGKPFKDHLDIKGHNEAIQFMLQLIKENRPFSESDIKDLHKIILVEPYYSKTISPDGIEFQKEIKVGQYKTSPNHVKTISGDIHYYTNPENVPYEMNQLLEWYREAENENLHPVVLSAIFHHKFTAIHPFDDGNGRLARILSNFILLKHQYPVVVIKNIEKTQYYASLNIADNGIYADLIQLFAENIAHSFEIYQKAINGENINEPDDLDKEIDLFTKEMQVQNIKSIDLKNENDKKFLEENYLKSLFNYLLPKLFKIGDFFQEFYIYFDGRKFHLKIANNYEELKKLLTIKGSSIKYKFCFEEAIKNKFTIDLDLRITFKNKTIEFEVLEEDYRNNSFMYNYEEIFSKEILYSEDSANTIRETSKIIVNYFMNEIKSNLKTNEIE